MSPYVIKRRDDSLLINAGFIVSTNRDYDQGIYQVHVKDYATTWCGSLTPALKKHILHEIPVNVIRAARKRKIIIVINNSAEGKPLILDGVDGFLLTHMAMKHLSLPAYSVLLFDSNQKFNALYHQWCVNNQCRPMIAHAYAFTHTFYFNRQPTYSLVNDAIDAPDSKDFSSLNRTMRQHRIDHLVQLITDEIVHRGLVSGYCSNDPKNPHNTKPKQIYTKISNKLHQSLLNRHLPLTIDGVYDIKNPDLDPATIFNFDIYKNSLLSVVTETAFHHPGAFLTEKIMKPIAAGHPFIILGQYRILDTLRNMGYQTAFKGIDQSYDFIEDPLERFAAVHQSLKSWVHLDRTEKIKYILESMPMIDHNKKTFAMQDYDRQSFSNLFNKCQSIFKSLHEKNKSKFR